MPPMAWALTVRCAEFAQAQDNVENAVIAFKDNRVVMVIASNECTADLDSTVDSALNS